MDKKYGPIEQNINFDNSKAIEELSELLKEQPNPYSRQVAGDHYRNKHDLAQFCIENGVKAGEFSVMKYVFRHEKKNGIEDLRKAKHWLEFLAYSIYGEVL